MSTGSNGWVDELRGTGKMVQCVCATVIEVAQSSLDPKICQ